MVIKRTKPSNVTTVNSATELSKRLNGREIKAGQFLALCPAHDDHNPSLSIGIGNNREILLCCFAGCSYEDIIKALRQKGISIHSDRKVKPGVKLPEGIIFEQRDGQRYVTHWTYKDEDGREIGHVARYESGAGMKSFLPYFKREQGRWQAGYPREMGDNRPLYNLDKINSASDQEEIWIAEGEKSADALTSLGVLATTSLGGSNAAGKADWTPLAGCKIVIWPDNDQSGRVYAFNVLKRLQETGDSDIDIECVNIDELNLPEKGDAVDWIAQGHDKKDLLSIPRIPLVDISDIGGIEIIQGEIYKAIDEAERILLKVAPHAIFQQGMRLVRVAKTRRRKLHQAKDEESMGICDVSSGYLLDLYDRKMTFVRRDDDLYVELDPPAKIATRYLARSGEWKLKPLTGVIYSPTIKPDGTVLERPGYDEQSGVFYDNAGARFSPIPRDTTKELATEALKRLRYPFQDFPFVNEEDESVVLAAILTALIRQSITTAPLFGFSAPVAASGKTLLANIISIIATGKMAATTPYGADREEERKQLFSILLQGKPILLIDNVERPLSSEVLCAILTSLSGFHNDRILGKSQMIQVPTNVTFLVTGNNLQFHGDMTRRVLVCTIDPQVENPERRTGFKIPQLQDFILKHRERYVRAGLTILKAYIDAGRPKQKINVYGTFEEWSDWVRSSLVWLGCKDPNLTRSRIESDDPTKVNLSQIMRLWRKIYGINIPVTVAQIVGDCNKALEKSDNTESVQYELAQTFKEITWTKGKQLDGDPIGKWLRSNRDRIQDGYKIIRDPNSLKSKVRWVLVRA